MRGPRPGSTDSAGSVSTSPTESPPTTATFGSRPDSTTEPRHRSRGVTLRGRRRIARGRAPGASDGKPRTEVTAVTYCVGLQTRSWPGLHVRHPHQLRGRQRLGLPQDAPVVGARRAGDHRPDRRQPRDDAVGRQPPRRAHQGARGAAAVDPRSPDDVPGRRARRRAASATRSPVTSTAGRRPRRSSTPPSSSVVRSRGCRRGSSSSIPRATSSRRAPTRRSCRSARRSTGDRSCCGPTTRRMSFEDAVKLLLVSFDSTIKANLSVGAPLDLSIYETDSLEPPPIIRIESADEYFSLDLRRVGRRTAPGVPVAARLRLRQVPLSGGERRREFGPPGPSCDRRPHRGDRGRPVDPGAGDRRGVGYVGRRTARVRHSTVSALAVTRCSAAHTGRIHLLRDVRARSAGGRLPGHGPRRRRTDARRRRRVAPLPPAEPLLRVRPDRPVRPIGVRRTDPRCAARRRVLTGSAPGSATCPGSSRPTDGAVATLMAGEGVCRDFAHLTCSLLRANDVAARVASVYAPGSSPMDFHAVTEALVDGRWVVIDPTGLAPRQSLVRIATGSDAADTAFLSTVGGRVDLTGIQVTAVAEPELPFDDVPPRRSSARQPVLRADGSVAGRRPVGGRPGGRGDDESPSRVRWK